MPLPNPKMAGKLTNTPLPNPKMACKFCRRPRSALDTGLQVLSEATFSPRYGLAGFVGGHVQSSIRPCKFCRRPRSVLDTALQVLSEATFSPRYGLVRLIGRHVQSSTRVVASARTACSRPGHGVYVTADVILGFEQGVCFESFVGAGSWPYRRAHGDRPAFLALRSPRQHPAPGEEPCYGNRRWLDEDGCRG